MISLFMMNIGVSYVLSDIYLNNKLHENNKTNKLIMELHRFFKQPVFLFIVFVFIGGQIFDLKVFAQTQEDSLVIITRFETSIKKINKESSTRDLSLIHI